MPATPNILMLVHSNYVDDNRVRRQAETLTEAGYKVHCVCVGLHISGELNGVTLQAFNPAAKSGKSRFIEVIRTFGKFIKETDADIIHAHDLDAFTAAGFYGGFKNKRVVYDSHELYLESMGLYKRPVTRFIWSVCERRYIKKANAVITVNDTIADILKEKYSLKEKPVVIRNFTNKPESGSFDKKIVAKVDELKAKFPYILLYHGMLRNGRGLDMMLDVLKEKPNWAGVICGDGPMKEKLLQDLKKDDLESRIFYAGHVKRADFVAISERCTAGFCYLEPVVPNHKYALPNKFSEYVQQGLPVIASDIPELKNLTKKWETGIATDNKKNIVAFLSSLENESERNRLTDKLKTAAKSLNWEAEKPKLLELYRRLTR